MWCHVDHDCSSTLIDVPSPIHTRNESGLEIEPIKQEVGFLQSRHDIVASSLRKCVVKVEGVVAQLTEEARAMRVRASLETTHPQQVVQVQ